MFKLANFLIQNIYYICQSSLRRFLKKNDMVVIADKVITDPSKCTMCMANKIRMEHCMLLESLYYTVNMNEEVQQFDQTNIQSRYCYHGSKHYQ